MTAPTSDRSRLLREERRRAGLCPVCGGERDKPGCVTCSACLRVIAVKSKLMRDRRDAAGLCPQCGGEREPGDRRKLCAACRVRLAANNRRSRERKEANANEQMDKDPR